MTAMNAEVAAKLRAPFSSDEIGKLPRVTCRACRDSQSKNCNQHQKIRCRDCNNWITTAHLHLDYVGHAETTDRLLSVDPGWTWEPVAFGANGLPLLDGAGGLWIRLTVAGVTRIGYGHAEGKHGPDAVKESIGDAIRNAAMRFGVALDLWGAKFKEPEDVSPVSAPPVQRLGQVEEPAARAAASAAALTSMSDLQRKRMFALFGDLDERDEVRQRTFIDWALGQPKGTCTSRGALTAEQADVVVAALKVRKAERGAAA